MSQQPRVLEEVCRVGQRPDMLAGVLPLVELEARVGPEAFGVDAIAAKQPIRVGREMHRRAEFLVKARPLEDRYPMPCTPQRDRREESPNACSADYDVQWSALLRRVMAGQTTAVADSTVCACGLVEAAVCHL